jgi:hypothetical protein
VQKRDRHLQLINKTVYDKMADDNQQKPGQFTWRDDNRLAVSQEMLVDSCPDASRPAPVTFNQSMIRGPNENLVSHVGNSGAKPYRSAYAPKPAPAPSVGYVLRPADTNAAHRVKTELCQTFCTTGISVSRFNWHGTARKL